MVLHKSHNLIKWEKVRVPPPHFQPNENSINGPFKKSSRKVTVDRCLTQQGTEIKDQLLEALEADKQELLQNFCALHKDRSIYKHMSQMESQPT